MFGRRRRTLWLTRLRGLPVLDAHAARQAGIVSELMIGPDGRLAALELAHGDGYLRRQVPADRVRALRRNMVVVVDAAELSFLPSHADPTGLISSETLVGLAVLNAGGQRLGRLADALVDAEEMRVVAYTLARPVWRRWQRATRLPVASVVSCSTEKMVVDMAAVGSPMVNQTRAWEASRAVRRAGGVAMHRGWSAWRSLRTGQFRRAKV